MQNTSRRNFIVKSAQILTVSYMAASGRGALAEDASIPDNSSLSTEQLRESWLNSTVATREINDVLILSRFVEPMYFLVQPIGWSPNAGSAIGYGPVDVPTGFVTDLTSIPRVFWSVLPRDGEYTYAAIIHDYLYWQQDRPRTEADDILRLAMEDLKVDGATITAIHTAVRLGGGSAWENNRQLRASGERRLLKVFPDKPTIRWEEWKKRKDVFL
jgi:hypothetical protein